MHIGDHLHRFIQDCNVLRSADELKVALGRAARAMGFEQFALNHHVDLVGPPEDAIVLMNYNPHWIDRSLSNGYHLDDPVHVASERACFGFYWQDIEKHVALTERHRKILGEARTYGLCDGFTVPVHVPGEYRGTCSFGARRVTANSELTVGAQLIGLMAFECARRLVRGRQGSTTPPPTKLTQRQRDCLPLIAAGKSDWVIGQLLNIRPTTVHQHVSDAMRRYGVSSRTQLIVRALFDGQIAYNAALRT